MTEPKVTPELPPKAIQQPVTSELTKEDYQKILTVLSQIGKTNLVTPEVFIQEIQPLIVKVSGKV